MTHTKKTNRILSLMMAIIVLLAMMPQIAYTDQATTQTVTVSADGLSVSEHTGLNITTIDEEEYLVIESGYSFTFVYSDESPLLINVKNSGTIVDGRFAKKVVNEGTIDGGTFHSVIENYGTINAGTFEPVLIDDLLSSPGIANYGGIIDASINTTIAVGGTLGIDKRVLGNGNLSVRQNGIEISNGAPGQVYNVISDQNPATNPIIGLYLLGEGESAPSENFEIDETVFRPILGGYGGYDFTMPDYPVTLCAVFANYGTSEYNISVVSGDEYAGTVTGTGVYVDNDDVTITATAADNYYFAYWLDNSVTLDGEPASSQSLEEAIVSYESTYTFKATKDLSLTAVFGYEAYAYPIAYFFESEADYPREYVHSDDEGMLPIEIGKEDVIINASDCPEYRDIEDTTYEIAGVILVTYDSLTDTESYTLTDSLTIPKAPLFESKEYYDWYIYESIIFAYKQHTHALQTLNNDSENHWYECECGYKEGEEAHIDEVAGDEICDVCQYDMHVHVAVSETEWHYDGEEHWNECVCNEKMNIAAHIYDDDTDASCNVCGYERHIHSWFLLKCDDLYHWNECVCNATINKTGHIDGNDADTLCDVCLYDVSSWTYFKFANMTDDFFTFGEVHDYSLGDYVDQMGPKLDEFYGIVSHQAKLNEILNIHQNDVWGGSCYGIAAIEMLANTDRINISDYDPMVLSLPRASAPAMTADKDVRSLINYAFMTQFIPGLYATTQFNSSPVSYRNAVLSLGEYIVDEEATNNKAMLTYFFNGGGHAIIIDGGVKNADGSYKLVGIDNRFHGFTYARNPGKQGQPVTVDVIISPTGILTVKTDPNDVYMERDGVLYYIPEIYEVAYAVEIFKAGDRQLDTLAAFMPLDTDQSEFVYEVWPTIIFKNTANGSMSISGDGFEFSLEDLESTDFTNSDVIRNVHPTAGSIGTITTEPTDSEAGRVEFSNTPGAVVLELSSVSGNYTINSPSGTVSVANGDKLTAITTDGAVKAQINNTDGSVEIKGNSGNFSVVVTNPDNTTAVVEGSANGNVVVTPKDNGIDLDAPAGTYNVEYKTQQGAVTTDTITIRNTSSNGGSGAGTPVYTVRFETNSFDTIASQTVNKNGKVTKPQDPEKEGYVFDGWYQDIELTIPFDFETKVTGNITLYAKWTKVGDGDPPASTWKNPFTDVSEGHWFYENVRYVNENNLMNGTSETAFSPENNLTRAMLVTVLYRLEGEPGVDTGSGFSDVKGGSYYEKAVAWAKNNGIVNGYSETEFGPDENITREQIAVIFHRYAQYKGYDVSVGENTNILSYDDFAQISEYAIASMQYAVGSGLMKGKTETTLNPKDFATRAEIAAILQRFIEANK